MNLLPSNADAQPVEQEEFITSNCTIRPKPAPPPDDALSKKHDSSIKVTEDISVSEEQRLQELRLSHFKSRSFDRHIHNGSGQLFKKTTTSSTLLRRRCHSEPGTSDLFQSSDEKQLQLRRSSCEANVRKMYEERKEHIEELFHNSWMLVSEDLEDEFD